MRTAKKSKRESRASSMSFGNSSFKYNDSFNFRNSQDSLNASNQSLNETLKNMLKGNEQPEKVNIQVKDASSFDGLNQRKEMLNFYNIKKGKTQEDTQSNCSDKGQFWNCIKKFNTEGSFCSTSNILKELLEEEEKSKSRIKEKEKAIVFKQNHQNVTKEIKKQFHQFPEPHFEKQQIEVKKKPRKSRKRIIQFTKEEIAESPLILETEQRRSERRKIKPLRFWLGERPIYDKKRKMIGIMIGKQKEFFDQEDGN